MMALFLMRGSSRYKAARVCTLTSVRSDFWGVVPPSCPNPALWVLRYCSARNVYRGTCLRARFPFGCDRLEIPRRSQIEKGGGTLENMLLGSKERKILIATPEANPASGTDQPEQVYSLAYIRSSTFLLHRDAFLAFLGGRLDFRCACSSHRTDIYLHPSTSRTTSARADVSQRGELCGHGLRGSDGHCICHTAKGCLAMQCQPQ